MASSGNRATSAPAASACSRAARMQAAFPSRSPTFVLTWQAATRRRPMPGRLGRRRRFDDEARRAEQLLATCGTAELEAARDGPAVDRDRQGEGGRPGDVPREDELVGDVAGGERRWLPGER